jgi:hypothetical protein
MMAEADQVPENQDLLDDEGINNDNAAQEDNEFQKEDQVAIEKENKKHKDAEQ